MFSRKLRRRVIAATAAVGLATLLAACSTTPTGSPASAGSSNGAGSSSLPSLDQLFKGSEGTPPATAPTPAKGKVIYWVSCGQQSAACSAYAAAGKAAVEAIGWEFHLVDANLNTANGNATALRTAIAAKPDAIVENGFSCSTVQPALEEAKAAGVPVLGLETLDCSDAGGPQLFTIPMKYSDAMPTNSALWSAYGAWAADYIIASSDDKAQTIANYGQGDPQFDLMNNAFKAEFAKCSGCSVTAEVPWTLSALTPNGPWITSLRNSVLQNPNATSTWFPFDFLAVETGGAKAVTEAGTPVSTVAGTGLASALDLIRSGGMTAEGWARSSEWMSWGGVDAINRYFNNSPAVSEGMGLVSIDKDHNMPATAGENYQTTVDYAGLYKKAWGVN